LATRASVGQCVGFLHEKPETGSGVDALIDVTGVPWDPAVGITLPDEESAGSRAGSHSALASCSPDDNGVARQLVQVDSLGTGIRNAVEGADQVGAKVKSFRVV
jgi:hypothetical protein